MNAAPHLRSPATLCGFMPMEQLTLYCLTQKLADLPTDESWLAAGERVRAAGFRFAKRRNDWILGRWTAKRALRA